MPTIRFHVEGDPKPMPKKQAFARRLPDGRMFARVFDSKTADGWKILIETALKPERPPFVVQGPVEVELRFAFRRPANLMTKKTPDGELPHTGKADVDNLTKSVFDALTQMSFWHDDGQVTRLLVEKCYAGKLERAGLLGTITWFDQPAASAPAMAATEMEDGQHG